MNLGLLILRDYLFSLGENDVFHFYPDDSEKKIQINNSNFTGKFELAAPETLKINIKNSIFNNTNIEIGSVPKVDIENSEINSELKTTSLTSIEDSVISNSKIENISSVESSFLEDVSIFNSPFSRIRDYNSKIDKDPSVESNYTAISNKDIEFL